MARVGVMQGTYLAVYIGEVCDFWKMDPPMRCRFCTTGLNVGLAEEDTKDVQDVVETARAAKAENRITFVHLNSGFHRDSGVDLAIPYVRAIKRDVGAMVGLQLAPDPDLSRYDRLIDLGVEHFSFCYEFQDPACFATHLPGKHRHLTQQAFFRALEYTSRRLGRGRVSGEIIAGIESVEDTKRAIDYITGAGAFPTICIFRPLSGADMAAYPPPAYEPMREIFEYAVEALRRNDIPIGLAPGLEVSLVVLPTDALELAPDTWAYRSWRARLAAMKWLAYPYFLYRMRRHDPGA
jgi:solute carrier family 13 (sodium-dependent dicarboxylate transporter), member 2/3/5